MSLPDLTDVEQVVIHPGEYRVTQLPMVLSTLLGSCVAACLYDPVNRVMGMNHFLLANRRYGKDTRVLASEAGRYGIHAMELLINGMLHSGAERRHLKAKAFGGGNVLGRDYTQGDDFFCVGAVNVRFLREFLTRDQIPLVAADLGGSIGRQIHFAGSDFSVYMRRIDPDHSRHLVDRERHYWRRSVAQRKRAEKQADFW